MVEVFFVPQNIRLEPCLFEKIFFRTNCIEILRGQKRFPILNVSNSISADFAFSYKIKIPHVNMFPKKKFSTK